MTELTQPITRERQTNAGGLGSIFDDHHEPGGLVTVAVGPYVERLPLGNSTVAQIRARFGPRFDIDPRTQAVLDGHEVGDDTVVRTGQVLMFVHKSGEKGVDKLQTQGSKRQRSFKFQALISTQALGHAGWADGSFPLTPALSLGERENRSTPLRTNICARSSSVSEANETRQKFHPLLWGEGRGEGEGIPPSRFPFKNRSSAWNRKAKPVWSLEIGFSFAALLHG